MSKIKFVSIKWKFAFLIIGALIILQGCLTYLTYLDTTRTFLQQGSKAQAQYFHIAEAIIKNSSNVLELFAESIFMVKYSDIPGKSPKDETISLFDENWPNWQLVWGFENAVLTDNHGKKIREWGIAPKNLNNQIQDVLKLEKPMQTTLCGDKCYTAITIPIISSFNLVGTLTLGRSLADGMIQYQEATDTDIVILSRLGKENTPKSYQWSAMTHSTRNNPLLEELRQHNFLNDLTHGNIIFPYQKRFYNIQAHPMESIGDSSSMVLIIDDITSEHNGLRSHLIQMVVSNLLGLLAILSVLFFLLNALLKRVDRLSAVLPLFAQHQYQEIRLILERKISSHYGYDEIDNLIAIAWEVSDQLEQLKEESQKKTSLLTKNSQALKKEKDFIEKLVQTAPILIITQTCSGEILFINHKGLVLYGAHQDELIGKSFDDFFGVRNAHHKKRLIAFRKSYNIESIQYDGDMISSSGTTHSVTWFHSTLYPETQEAPIILTIGLDITDRKRAEEQMVWLATHDHLTGLSNLRNFNHEFEKIIDQAKRYGQQVALFYLDLDQFKIINDTQGHHKGDVVLQTVAQTLIKITRKSDLICRIGGDEFTLLIPNAKSEGVLSLAKKINEVLNQTPVDGVGHNFKISASIGISFFPQHGSSIHDLLSNADLAMYHAKESGYGQFHIYSNTQQYHVRLTQKMYWKHVIEEAIENDRFVLYFQPILDLQKDRISHYECLVRLRSEDGTIVSPGEFIEFAEDLGLIGQIDRLVMAKAISQHIEFNKLDNPAGLSINLSGRSLNDETVYLEIRRLLTLPGVNPEKIIFEVTETSAVSNFSSAQNLINEIKNFGCQFAIDDFGVGFSSFRYLKNLAVDYIKIDGAFIKKIDQSYEDRIFVKSMSDISHALDKKTIAEFVENKEIMSILREYKIDFAQGYHIGKPEPLENILQ